VPGIVPTLKADHGVGAACKPVDNLAFAFVAPLGADYGYICHYGFPETTHAFCQAWWPFSAQKGFSAKGFAVGPVMTMDAFSPPQRKPKGQ
jgi:hypothetical protein